MKLGEPFFAIGGHLALDLPGARVLFTTRRGGVSRGAYSSLNLGRGTNDDQCAVQHNRDTLRAQLSVRFAEGRQVHGAKVRRVCKAAAAACTAEGAQPADGQATALPGVAPMVLVADCLPVAVAGQGSVAMLHAGWRGLAAGVLAEGVQAVRELGGPGPLSAAIGPGAGGCCYQVGEDVHREFDAVAGGGGCRRQTLDLKAIARIELERAGVEVVHDAGLCTICSDRALFFSHRRDRGITGRQAGIAWLS